RNTRVLAPEAMLVKELPSGTIVSGGYLLDAITSASAAAGVASDQPFTELRNQVTLGLAQRIGPVTVGGSYRHSTESDYWAHVFGLDLSADLAQHNTQLGASLYYDRATVGMRMGARGYTLVGKLDSLYGMAFATQVLRHDLIAAATVEVADEGSSN